MQFSEDQILTLAPDESSRKAGKELANPNKWVSKGMNEVALWGECQGSGSKPYQTQIDIVNIAFKCSCPSRKFPCKHGLGLLLFYTRNKSSFRESTAPAWVTDWLSKRTEKAAVEKKDKPVDEAAQAKRQQARQQKVANGIEELAVWLQDIVRNGIINMPEKGAAFWENISRRMVDAQAPALGGMVTALENSQFHTEGWQSRFMSSLVRIYLVAEGYKHMAELDEVLQQDLRTAIGFTQSQEELKEQEGLTDTWLVLHKESIETENNITNERYWLYGTKSNRPAIILQYLVRGQGGQLNLVPGTYSEAELVFYPSRIPLRAIIKQQHSAQAAPVPVQKMENWQAVVSSETILSSLLPFRLPRPYVIQQLKPVQHNREWWLQDASGSLMKMQTAERNIWKMLAISGGEALDMVVIGMEDQYEPVGAWHQGTYKNF